MKNLREIWNAYKLASGALDEGEQRARSKASREAWGCRRILNDHAYFVMLFACFEDRVTSRWVQLVKANQGLRSWRRRRVWDTLDASKPEWAPFLRKLALLLDKGSADYGSADELWGVRCRIAHGASAQVGAIDVAKRYREICRLWRVLRV